MPAITKKGLIKKGRCQFSVFCVVGQLEWNQLKKQSVRMLHPGSQEINTNEHSLQPGEQMNYDKVQFLNINIY